MSNLQLPKIGSRNLKTALAVFICLLLFKFRDTNPLYACIAAIICMKDTVESSFSMGKNRLIGTLLGGCLGVIFIFILDNIPYISNTNPLLISIGIIIAIYICNIFKKAGSVTICCIVFISIMINYDAPTSYLYAVSRSFDTAIGIIVAIFVNKYIHPPKSSTEDELK